MFSLHIENIFMRKEGTLECVLGILEITRGTDSVYIVSIKSQLDSTGPVPHVAVHVEHSGASFLCNF